MQEIILGATYKDKITCFKGVAIGHVVYLTDCSQTLLAPTLDKNGNQRDNCWYDDQRLERVGKKVVKIVTGKQVILSL